MFFKCLLMFFVCFKSCSMESHLLLIFNFFLNEGFPNSTLNYNSIVTTLFIMVHEENLEANKNKYFIYRVCSNARL